MTTTIDETPAEKPPMTEQEASWHETQAAIRAGEAARASGGDPNAVEAVLGATDEPETIAGRKLAPASLGQLWVTQQVNNLYRDQEDNIWRDLALGALIAIDPKRVRSLLKGNGVLKPGGPEAVRAALEEAAFEIAADMGEDDLGRLSARLRQNQQQLGIEDAESEEGSEGADPLGSSATGAATPTTGGSPSPAPTAATEPPPEAGC